MSTVDVTSSPERNEEGEISKRPVTGAWNAAQLCQALPGALRKLATGKLGIALLMTMSATGAVILGHVEEAAALAFLYSIAEALEDRAMDRARAGLRALLKLVPQSATVLTDGHSASVPARDLAAGQVMLIRPGERIATDGIVVAGAASIDENMLTGEAAPVEAAAPARSRVAPAAPLPVPAAAPPPAPSRPARR